MPVSTEKKNKITIETSISELKPVRFVLVNTEQEKRMWDFLLNRYHYLGHKKIFGKNPIMGPR